MIFVTGGAGFIGSNFVLDWLATEHDAVLNIDKLSYASDVRNLADAMGNPRYHFSQTDLCDRQALADLFERYHPEAVVHLAAETHVDRSIASPGEFVQANLIGTFNLLDVARLYWQTLSAGRQRAFRFVHVSTDEVYGALDEATPPVAEGTACAPNNPYAATKAGADQLARAYWKTYGFPVITTHCSNNYGPHQYEEKLIPRMILHACRGLPLTLYGDGRHVRDWLYVTDHCRALRLVLGRGKPGTTYNIGGGNEMANADVVSQLCAILDELRPRPGGGSYAQQIAFVQDRPGHDRRYALDARKIRSALGWRPAETFATGLRKTVAWYLDHRI